MDIAPKLTAEEFSDIHNAKCELYGILQTVEGVMSDKLCKRMENAITLMNKGLARAYAEDNAAGDKKSNHYIEIGKLNNFDSIWSIHEVEDLRVDHPFKNATKVIYKDHWGGAVVEAEIGPGTQWVHLWAAADKAIARSGDTHHVFIEKFIPCKKQKNVLYLSTGS